MRDLDFGRWALGICVAAAMLAGCGGSQPPIAGPDAMSARSGSTHRQPRQTSGSSQDLLYIQTTQSIVIVSISTWQIVGTISGYNGDGGVCSDPYTGNVFVPQAKTVVEYAHGGTTPIATLAAPKGYTYLRGCSVDPTTQNLAMTSAFGPYEGSPPAVIVFPGEQDYPTIYHKKKLSTLGDTAYDAVGNLYVDVYDNHGRFFIGEIRAGQSQFNLIRLKSDLVVGKMQWDGSYLVGWSPSSTVWGQPSINFRSVATRPRL
jgi:hypothetical protein